MRRFGELEAVIMDRLWERGRPMLVREMVDALHDDRALAYTTVMTVMENLHRKGWLRRERDGRAWRYEPTGSRSSYTAALMNDALATSPDRRTALTHFALQMSPHDAALLRQLDAVLAHERAHLTGRHHRLLALARIGRGVLPFLPLMRDAEEQVARLVELHADDAATRGRDPRLLATALVVLATAASPAPALSAGATDSVQRIHRILGPSEPLGRARRQLLRATAAALALTPVLLALTPAVVALALGRLPGA